MDRTLREVKTDSTEDCKLVENKCCDSCVNSVVVEQSFILIASALFQYYRVDTAIITLFST